MSHLLFNMHGVCSNGKEAPVNKISSLQADYTA